MTTLNVEFLQSALDAVTEEVYVVDPDRLAFVYVNGAALRQRRVSRDELMAMGPAGLLRVEPDLLRRDYLAVVAGGEPAVSTAQLRHLDADGLPIWVEARRSPVRIDGRWHIVSVIRDISARHARDQERQAQDERLHKLVSQVPGAIFQYLEYPDGSYSFPWASDGMVAMLGVRPEEVCRDGEAAFRYFHPDDRRRLAHAVRRCAEELAPLRHEAVVDLPGLGPCWRHIRATPERLEDGGTLWHGFITDITERVQTQKQLRRDHDRLRHLLDAMPVRVALLDAAGTVVLANDGQDPAGRPHASSPPGGAITAHAWWAGDSHARNVLAAELVKAQGGQATRCELSVVRPGGEPDTFDLGLSPLRDAKGAVAEIVLTAVDTAARRKAQYTSSLFARLFEQANDAILIADAHNRIVAVNAAFEALTGYTREEVLGRQPGLLSSGQTPPQVYQEMWHQLRKEGFWRGEVIDRRKDGKTYPKALTISAIREAGGGISNFIATFTDLSRDREAEAKLLYLARHDTLTGLANRTRLAERLDQVLWEAADSHDRFAVIFVDVDHLKDINDSLGHSAGDILLREVAHRLAGCVRSTDLVARFGGDEFVIVVDRLASTTPLERICTQILKTVGEPLSVEGAVINPGCSVGVAVYPDDGIDRESLLMNADAAMYHAKTSGRNNYRFYNAALRTAAESRVRFDRELRQALELNQFELFYQPKVDLQGVIRGFEALLRWRHPLDGLVSPMRFIPYLEQSGLIKPVGQWVLHAACQQLQAWRSGGFDGSMAINVAERQLRTDDLVEAVRVALDNHGLPPQCLEIEITESAALHDPQQARQVLAGLRALGVKVSLDDFGTGYSSLGHLKTLPIDCVKLDRSFQPETVSDVNTAICRAAIAMAHALDLVVVAEGVETPAQHTILHDLGVDLMQGYLFGRPEPAQFWDAQAMSRRFTVPAVS